MRIFVSGTDTDAGKTVVCAWLALHWKYAYWKPVQCGTADGTDRERVRALGVETVFPEYALLPEPRSPHAAAALAGTRLRVADIHPPANAPDILIEGAGGLLVPLNDDHTMLDLIVHLASPVILVARAGLGTINHTLLSIAALRARRIPLLGIILTGAGLPENPPAIEHFGKTKIIGSLPRLARIDRENLLRIQAPDLVMLAAKQALP